MTWSSSSQNDAAVGMMVLFGLWTVAIAVLWLWIGWRAMRAHEQLADAVGRLARDGGQSGPRGAPSTDR